MLEGVKPNARREYLKSILENVFSNRMQALMNMKNGEINLPASMHRGGFYRVFIFIRFFPLFRGSVFMDFIGFYRVLLGFYGFYWVSSGFTGFYLVLLGFTELYWVLLGYLWVLLGFIVFYWVLLGFDGFDRVLVGGSDFSYFKFRCRLSPAFSENSFHFVSQKRLFG